MRLVVEIPGWAQERDIYVVAGIELLAIKPWDREVVLIKTERCNQCGKCCTNLHSTVEIPINESHACIHLKENLCSLRSFTPWQCVTGEPNLFGKDDDCSIRYKEVQVE